jgi:hypothetical protein
MDADDTALSVSSFAGAEALLLGGGGRERPAPPGGSPPGRGGPGGLAQASRRTGGRSSTRSASPPTCAACRARRCPGSPTSCGGRCRRGVGHRRPPRRRAWAWSSSRWRCTTCSTRPTTGWSGTSATRPTRTRCSRPARPHPHAAPARRPVRLHPPRRERLRPVRGAHSSTSISAGLGMAVAARLEGRERNVVCVTRDGAMSAGMAYEAMNNGGRHGRAADRGPQRQRHVDRAAGGRHERYLSRVISSHEYRRLRDVAQAARRRPAEEPQPAWRDGPSEYARGSPRRAPSSRSWLLLRGAARRARPRPPRPVLENLRDHPAAARSWSTS